MRDAGKDPYSSKDAWDTGSTYLQFHSSGLSPSPEKGYAKKLHGRAPKIDVIKEEPEDEDWTRVLSVSARKHDR